MSTLPILAKMSEILSMLPLDINPHNVFWRGSDSAFAIGDFDSCTLEGDEMGAKAGTDGWTNDDFEVAHRENDWFGFAKIEEFIDSNRKKTQLLSLTRN